MIFFLKDERKIPRCQANRPVYIVVLGGLKRKNVELSGQYRRRIIPSRAGSFEKTRFVLLYYIIL